MSYYLMACKPRDEIAFSVLFSLDRFSCPILYCTVVLIVYLVWSILFWFYCAYVFRSSSMPPRGFRPLLLLGLFVLSGRRILATSLRPYQRSPRSTSEFEDIELDQLSMLPPRQLKELHPHSNAWTEPVSNEEAQSIYGSALFAEIDQFGQPRASIDEQLWVSSLELVPEYVFSQFRRNKPAASAALDEDEDQVEGVTKGGEIIQLLERPIGSTTYSMVYGLAGKSKSKWAIKYHVFCPVDLGHAAEIDPLLREAYFMELLHNFEIAPKILYFSKPSSAKRLFSEVSPKWNPRLTNELQTDCPTPSVRYMIVSKVGESIQQLMARQSPHPRIPFLDAVDVTIAVVRLLQQLHQKHIAHGDIHIGNVAWTRKPSSSSSLHKNYSSSPLRLIDFGRAVIVSPVLTEAVVARLKGAQILEAAVTISHCHEYYSQWEIFNYPPSFRDDLYRVMLMMVVMTYGGGYASNLGKTCLMDKDNEGRWVYINPGALAMAKAGFRNLFNVSIQLPHNQLKSYSLEFLLNATRLAPLASGFSQAFSNVMIHIRSLDYAQMPDHEYILTQLEGIRTRGAPGAAINEDDWAKPIAQKSEWVREM